MRDSSLSSGDNVGLVQKLSSSYYSIECIISNLGKWKLTKTIINFRFEATGNLS